MANNSSLNTTPYSDNELNHFKDLLEKERQETLEEKNGIQDSLDNLQSNSSDENSAAAHHQGDIASEEDEREKFLLMMEKQNHKLEEVTAALKRIEEGTYGVCETTAKKIPKERLEAIPYTRYSIEARKKEENRRS